MRYTRAVTAGPKYDPTSAVVLTEVMKLVCCLLVVFHIESYCIKNFTRAVRTGLAGNVAETVKLLVPAGLYTLQNNLLFVALENLEATTFQVTYQLKLLITALFSVFLLGKTLSPTQWGSLVVLTTGVVLIQLPSGTDRHRQDHKDSWVLGLTACIVSGTSSAFASVYFEKILKSTPTSLWMRNIQLGVFALPLSYATMVATSPPNQPIFYGYTAMTWVLIAVQAFGGLLVAAVMKFADNILKGFATALAIALSGVVSAVFLGFVPSFAFLLGASTVIGATVLYSLYPPKAPSPFIKVTTL
eukprot:Sspe_Gene.84057::Locus_55175_Transcript_1_1_Confidence_1.000_Length_1502::g.84057::m.84057/K15272/SLC35A1_2_3; solute carrier family 35 (UDP-sugar transporter), member A1/2/3